MKTKTFDCVEMKNRMQGEIMAEYRAHKDEFASFVAFIRARVGKSRFAREMRKKLGGPTAPAPVTIPIEDFTPLGPPRQRATRPTAQFNSILSIVATPRRIKRYTLA